MEKIAIANHKGGVGKTTTAINLSSILAEKGYRVLAMDLDPQAHLSVGFGINIQSSTLKGVDHVINGTCLLEDAAIPVLPNLSVIPAHDGLETSFRQVANEKYSYRIYEALKMGLSKLNGFDFVIMDTEPARGSLLVTNALAFANRLIIPTEAACFSIVGIAHLVGEVGHLSQQWINRNLDLFGILITLYQENRDSNENQQVLLCSELKNKLFNTKIRKNVALQKASTKRQPINIYDRRSNGYMDYAAFADELLQKLGRNIFMEGKTANATN